MDSVEQQLGEMSKEFGARSNVTVVLESVFFTLILLLLFVGNFATLLIIALNSRMRTTTNMFVASLAISDLRPLRFALGPQMTLRGRK